MNLTWTETIENVAQLETHIAALRVKGDRRSMNDAARLATIVDGVKYRLQFGDLCK